MAHGNNASNACERSHVASSGCTSSTKGAHIDIKSELRGATGVVRDRGNITPVCSGHRNRVGLGTMQVGVRCHCLVHVQ